MNGLAEKEQARFAALKAAYELSGGDELNWFSIDVLAERAGLTKEQAQAAFDYLQGEGLVVPQAFGGTSGITHRGVVEFEKTLKDPGQSTEHFRVAVIQQFQGPVGAVQTGNGAMANIAQSVGLPLLEVEALLDTVLKATATLPPLTRQNLIEQIEELRAELAEPKPKGPRIKASLVTMWQGAQGIATLAPIVLELAQKLGYPLL